MTVSQADFDALKGELDQFFLIVMGMIVFLMQCGFAFLEAGSVRRKNTSNILIKNLLDSFVAGIAYWIIGYPFAYGDPGNSFIGYANWAHSDLPNTKMAEWFFQFVFAATAATIVSGALAERCEFFAYFIYSFGITGFIYPVVSHWGWASNGWLVVGDEYEIDGNMTTVGYMDFAGSGIVHCVGGAAAFVGAACMGPRMGRFTGAGIRGHSTPFSALGGFILLFGFLAFNGGSVLAITGAGNGETLSLAVVNTIISGSSAAFVVLSTQKCVKKNWSLLDSINGALAGMVAICAGCNVVATWGACVIGVLAALSYLLFSWAMVKMKVDDPLDAVAVHYGGGCVGLIGVALLKYSYGASDNGILIDWDRQSGLMLAWQLAGLISITVWTIGCSALLFGILRLTGMLRVSKDIEMQGLDITEHGEPAYPLESNEHLAKIIQMLETGQLTSSDMGYNNGAFDNNSEILHQMARYQNAEAHAKRPAPGNGAPQPNSVRPTGETTQM